MSVSVPTSARADSTASFAKSATLPTFTNDQISDFLALNWLGGASFNIGASRTLTVNITALSTGGKLLAATALEAWGNVTGITFTQVSGTAGITFSDNQAGAFAGPDSVTGSTINSASVNVSNSWVTNYGTGLDAYAFSTYIHEIGHALGLDHAGNYNGTATYATDGTGDNHYLNDSWQATVMSYFDQAEAGTGSYASVFTPMIADILAMQTLYGVDGGLRTGNTIYGEGSNVGGYYDQASTLANPIAFTIIDDGGIDTINFSSTTANQRIDLNPEAISDIGGYIGNMIIMRDTIIENFKSGSGNDSLTGNVANNTFWAGGGNDMAWGAGGVDIIWGQTGNDKIWGDGGGDQLYGGAGFDKIWGGNGQDVAVGGGGKDKIWGQNGNDHIWGDGGDDSIWGGSGNDKIWGGNSHDTIEGNSGNDQIWGENGNDLISGGQGADIIRGGGGLDEIYGNGFKDTLLGGSGNDILHGDGGDDILKGGNGIDQLYGGTGKDNLFGGAGADYFSFGVNSSVDRVNDFENNLDTIWLGTAIWGGAALTAANVISLYGSVVANHSGIGAHVELNFGGGDIIKIFGISNTADLLDDITIF